MSGTSVGLPSIDQAREQFVSLATANLKPVLDAALEAAHKLNEQPAERAVAQQRSDAVQELMRHGAQWLPQLTEALREQLTPAGAVSTSTGALLNSLKGEPDLELVDDATIQRNILVSRLTLAILDKATWEFADLRARLSVLTKLADLDESDVFRPQTLARTLMSTWLKANLSLPTWRLLESTLHSQCGKHFELAYQQTNAWLVQRGVQPETNLRNFIRRSDGTTTDHGRLSDAETAADRARTRPGAMSSQPVPLGASTPRGRSGTQSMGAPTAPGAMGAASRSTGGYTTSTAPASSTVPLSSTGRPHDIGEETRMMTRHPAGAMMRSELVLEKFSDILERHIPGFRDTGHQGRQPSARLSDAMAQAQMRVVAAQGQAGAAASDTPEHLVQELRERQQALKQAANTPEERATVELVALLFQAILTDERIPTSLRVWFARLQMPTLRVALAEPDFFAGVEHPARKLIDRLGACVMGFEGGAEIVGSPLEAEIRRVVQVVEAFPDTGRRVFQAVLTEFEKFLERYYREHNEVSRVGVSLAQQIEQRETLAVQYTIELRKLIDEVPVHDGVREFLFHIWADVLATTAVRHSVQSPELVEVREAAVDLMWTASAKTTREERADVIRRLPPLLGILRKGMTAAGLDATKQEAAIKSLNVALTAAFSSRATAINPQQLEQLKQRLAAIEELLPEDDIELDDSWVLDEANHHHEGLEIVAEGGSMPGPSMVAAAGELQLGDAFMLDYRSRREPVRLAWQGMHKQLTLFVTPQGRCVLFQKNRLAAFLQAGLLVPAQDESLTLAATRDALRKLSADPSRLSV